MFCSLIGITPIPDEHGSTLSSWWESIQSNVVTVATTPTTTTTDEEQQEEHGDGNVPLPPPPQATPPRIQWISHSSAIDPDLLDDSNRCSTTRPRPTYCFRVVVYFVDAQFHVICSQLFDREFYYWLGSSRYKNKNFRD